MDALKEIVDRLEENAVPEHELVCDADDYEDCERCEPIRSLISLARVELGICEANAGTRGEVEWLDECCKRLLAFAGHSPGCTWTISCETKPCDCGFAAVVADYKEST